MTSRAGGLILVGLMALVLALFPEACVAKEGQQCTPSSCGNVRNISYPFRLNGDSPECGDRNYELSCENNRTTLNECGGKYYVQEIDYANRRMQMVDASLVDEDSCSILHYSLTDRNFTCPSDPNPYCLYSSPDNAILVLVDCTQPVNSSLYVDITSFHVDVTPCIDSSSSPRTGYYGFYGHVRLLGLPEQCSIQFVAPARFLNSTGGPLSIHDIRHELLKGFRLWYFSPGDLYYKESFKQKFQGFLRRLQEFFRDFRDYVFSTAGYHKIFGDVGELRRRKRARGWNAPWLGQYASYVIKGLYVGRTSLGILCFIALCMYKFRQRHLSIDETIEEFLQSHNNFMPIRYSYLQIKEMTNGFKDKLGQGGFGSVYKGKTRSGHLVAVKVLGTSKANGQDFINEVATIGRIHHVNVVRLTGFCAEGSKRALIYDFMTNGSLDKFIFHKGEQINPLSWKSTYEIGLGVARGIEYLHQGCDMQILHFDIKPHNILLDENFIPKVSDFGLAKLYAVDNSIVSLTAARGTLGYIAPELFYKNIGGVSYKADVYSFGMLLMEMVGKRKNVNTSAEYSSQIYFPTWIYDQISQGEDIESGDGNEDGKKIARKMIIVALWCTQLNPVDRPSMNKVLEMLEGDVELLQMPPKPLITPQEMSVVDQAGNNPRPISSYNDIGTITLDVR